MNMNYKVVSKAQIIKSVAKVNWQDSLKKASIAKRTNKTQLCLAMINSSMNGIDKAELQEVTGWDSHNLHSTFRKSFCEKHGIVYDYKLKKFFSEGTENDLYI